VEIPIFPFKAELSLVDEYEGKMTVDVGVFVDKSYKYMQMMIGFSHVMIQTSSNCSVTRWQDYKSATWQVTNKQSKADNDK
jgi:hypothetical protein